MSEVFSITKEQCKQLDHEYMINDCIYYLMKSRGLVGGNKTIDEAIEELKLQTRFADEFQENYKKSLGGLASDYLT